MAKGRITIDEAFCKGCGLCEFYCPKKVIELDMERVSATGYNPASAVRPDDCVACGACYRVCPDCAITVEKL
ncbi:MAG: 4Fe-4S binding protein [Firmicutes bacterium]|nr:4Fe-4S binding protein [Bacillota bacterium]